MAPLDRHTVTIIGSISGVRPTATARAKKNASFQSPLVRPLMTKTSGTMTSMKRIISQVNWLTPLSKLVCTCWPTMALGHAAQVGRAARWRRRPPWPCRSRRWCPGSRCSCSSSGDLARGVFAGVELLDRERFAGEARLDDEQVLAGDEAHVGRDHVAGRQLDHVAGHQLAERQSRAAGRRGRTVAVTLIIALSLAAAVSARASCTKPQHHAQDHHREHHRRRPEVAGQQRHGGQQQQQDHQRD